MNNDFNPDEMDETEEPTTLQKVKEWTQENLRIIVSVLIVFLIASSIYSYSKRGSEVAEVTEDSSEIEDILTDLSSEDATDETETPTEPEDGKDEEVATTTPKAPAKVEAPQAEPQKEAPQQVTEAKETENSFVETAQRGDGTTHLARKALAHYLEKNADSSLTAEHKIYIEDYLRKNVSSTGHIMVGNSVEFSKSLIKQAIDASKNLNDAQLKNLQKYSANVNF